MRRQSFILLLAVCMLVAAGSVTWFLQSSSDASAAADNRAPRSSSPTRPVSKTKPARSSWSQLTNDSLPSFQRLEIARQISESMSQEDVAVLFAAMDHNPPSGAEEDWYLILNEILEQMRRKGTGADQYATKLGAIITDPTRPEVIRDYAIQHLMLWIGPGNPDQVPHEQNSAAITLALGQIATAIQDPTNSHTSIPGTALLALADISPRLPSENIADSWLSLEPYLHGVISGDTNPQLSTRVSAIQAVSITSQQAFLPAIRTFATSETTEPSVRLSSIASLGLYANPEDKPLLESIAKQDTRYKYAAQSALKSLSSQ